VSALGGAAPGRAALADDAVAPLSLASAGTRAALGRRLRRLEREAWDRERERRRRHEALLRRWPARW
jgi:hypothetical protein